MAELPELTYFDGRGRAEIIRILLCAGKIKVGTIMVLDNTNFHGHLNIITDIFTPLIFVPLYIIVQ